MIGQFMDSLARKKFATFFDRSEFFTEDGKAILMLGREEGDWIRVSFDPAELASLRMKLMDYCVKAPVGVSPLGKKGKLSARERMKVIFGGKHKSKENT